VLRDGHFWFLILTLGSDESSEWLLGLPQG
jgi:hypothetical protein